ncbi:MAG TPA: AAA family ATPase [Saprospiraceae bacterium]|nr:AAA family ATPase [Saprospiraceae bacterium]
MEILIAASHRLIHSVPDSFIRYLYHDVRWHNRLIGIKGARGTGKTTLLLQYLKHSNIDRDKKVYLSLDDLYFIRHSILDFGVQFYQNGGKLMVLDEVHKYPNWSKEIKNLYDRHPDLQIIFTGSSIIEITKMEGDLSRRALMYELKGLSYREYLAYNHDIHLPILKIEDLIHKNKDPDKFILNDFKPLKYFKDYLTYGYYPFAMEDKDSYHLRIRQLIRTIVEYDMAEVKGLDIRQSKKILHLLNIISQQVPFKPNITSIAEKSGIHRNSINNYLYYLEEARLIALLQHHNFSIASLQKPEKIYLDNTNHIYALSEQTPNIGNVRETFFFNQVSYLHSITYAENADFLVDSNLTFEIGGSNKSTKQIKSFENAYVVKDEIEVPVGRTIPLWMFGLLY